ncbi:hypothetical protein YPPY07_0310, partial [Yersinia pestis PY-07]
MPPTAEGKNNSR